MELIMKLLTLRNSMFLKQPKLTLLFILFLFLVGCDFRADTFRRDLTILGTTAEIVIEGLPPQDAETATTSIVKDLEIFDQIGFTFEPANELAQLNEAFSKGQAKTVSAELKELIHDASKLYSMSDGLFNPAAGELTALWEYPCGKADCTKSPYSEEVQHLIDEKESEIIAQHPSMDDLVIKGNSVSSQKPAVKLEFGDMIRGFALDRSILKLNNMGIQNAMIFLGNGVHTLGKQGREQWLIGLPLHSNAQKMVGTIRSTGNEAVVTVHAIDKSISKAGTIYRHVVDPRTGLPVRETQSVTIIHDSAATANAAAAALLINGKEGWANIADKMGVHLILMIAKDGTVYTTPGMDKRIRWKPSRAHQKLLP